MFALMLTESGKGIGPCTDFSPSYCLLLCCKDQVVRGALLPLSLASPLPLVGCRGKGMRGSQQAYQVPHQVLWRIKPGEGKSMLSMKTSSCLHCQGRERHVLLGTKMSRNFPNPSPENSHCHHSCVLSLLAQQGPVP